MLSFIQMFLFLEAVDLRDIFLWAAQANKQVSGLGGGGVGSGELGGSSWFRVEMNVQLSSKCVSSLTTS